MINSHQLMGVNLSLTLRWKNRPLIIYTCIFKILTNRSNEVRLFPRKGKRRLFLIRHHRHHNRNYSHHHHSLWYKARKRECCWSRCLLHTWFP